MSSCERHVGAAADAAVSLIIWWLLYAGLPILIRAGFDDARRVFCEGVADIFLLALFMRDRGSVSRRPAKRTGWTISLVIPVFIAMYAAIEMFCLSGAERPAEPAGVSVWHVLRTCVTAPLMEELGCRWIAFDKMRRGFGFWPSALASAVLFSLIHVDVNLRLAVAVVPSTLLYCLVCELTGRIGYCVAGHVIFNLLALPGTAWSGSALERRLWGAPASISVPLLISVTAVIALLCVFRDRIFVPHGRPSVRSA